MTKNIKIILIVIAIIAIGGYLFPRGNSIVEQAVEKLGAVPTLDGVTSPFVAINGVKDSYVSQGLIATSSTICSIANPRGATTTVLSFSVKITTGILGANNVSLSTSTNSYATSAPVWIIDRAIGSNLGDSFMWLPNIATTTSGRILPAVLASGENAYFLRPGERLNLRIATTTGAGALAAYYQGTCSAVFRDN
jgi:hypothetical protein